MGVLENFDFREKKKQFGTTEPYFSERTDRNRIIHEFHTKCGLSQSSQTNITQTQFVDHSLRHHQKRTELVGQCEMDDYGQAIYEERGMVDKYFNKRSFSIAMEMYCDMKSGIAFHSAQRSEEVEAIFENSQTLEAWWG